MLLEVAGLRAAVEALRAELGAAQAQEAAGTGPVASPLAKAEAPAPASVAVEDPSAELGGTGQTEATGTGSPGGAGCGQSSSKPRNPLGSRSIETERT